MASIYWASWRQSNLREIQLAHVGIPKTLHQPAGDTSIFIDVFAPNQWHLWQCRSAYFLRIVTLREELNMIPATLCIGG